MTRVNIARLKKQGYDGLYLPDGSGGAECGCKWKDCHDGCPLSGDRNVACLPGVMDRNYDDVIVLKQTYEPA